MLGKNLWKHISRCLILYRNHVSRNANPSNSKKVQSSLTIFWSTSYCIPQKFLFWFMVELVHQFRCRLDGEKRGRRIAEFMIIVQRSGSRWLRRAARRSYVNISSVFCIDSFSTHCRHLPTLGQEHDDESYGGRRDQTARYANVLEKTAAINDFFILKRIDLCQRLIFCQFSLHISTDGGYESQKCCSHF